MRDIRAPTIMVIGADVNFNYLMQRYVRQCGCTALVSQFSSQTVSVVQQTQPALILLEIEQADETGWDLLRALKIEPATRDIPVVVCSWLACQDRCLAEGAAIVLQKPVLYGDLIAALTYAGILDAGIDQVLDHQTSQE